MKTIPSFLVKFFGAFLAFLGFMVGLGGAIGFGTTISQTASTNPSAVPASVVALIIFGIICILLIRGGRKLLRHGNEIKELETIKKRTKNIALQDCINEQKRLLNNEVEKHNQLMREEKKQEETRSVYLNAEQIEKLENRTELPCLDECELILQHGEVAVYGSTAKWGKNSYEIDNRCHMYLTNYRVAFIAEEYGFILDRSEILAVGKREHGLMLQLKQGSYLLDLPRADLAYIAFSGLNNGMPIANMPTGFIPSDSPSNELQQIVDVSMVDGMDGHAFEYFCAELLKKNGFTNVEVTKGSGDQGVDILAEKGQIRYAIQCKNYATRLGNTPIQEVNAGKVFYKCHVGVVMTNSTFTPSANELATTTNVLLWDRDVLDKFIKAANITLESI
ncbi:MAG: restriction endonuclease [Muribaculaceae bacterium]